MQAAAKQAQAQGWARSELSQLLQVVPEVELPEWLMASGWVMGWELGWALGWAKESRLHCQLHLRTGIQEHTRDKCAQADPFPIQQVQRWWSAWAKPSGQEAVTPAWCWQDMASGLGQRAW